MENEKKKKLVDKRREKSRIFREEFWARMVRKMVGARAGREMEAFKTKIGSTARANEAMSVTKDKC